MSCLLSAAPISDWLLDVKAFDRIWGPKRWIVLTNWAAILGERHPPQSIFCFLSLISTFDEHLQVGPCYSSDHFRSSPGLLQHIYSFHMNYHEPGWSVGGRQDGAVGRHCRALSLFIFSSTEIVLDSKAWEQECSESFKSLSSFHAGYAVLRPTDQFDDIIYCTVDLFANLTVK
jgi:hypothetical protein